MVHRAAAALIGGALLFAGTEAVAHPRFVSSSPARGAVVGAAPKAIRVSFSEAVLARGSRFALSDASGKPIRTGALAPAPGDGRTLVLPIVQPLTPGAYTVRWQVLAAGHTAVPGLLRFQVRR